MKKTLLLIGAAVLAICAFAQPEEWVPAGSVVNVRTNEFINARNADGRVYGGTVNDDVIDSKGRLAVPRGSHVELIVRRISPREMVLDMEAIDINGHHYSVRADADAVRGDVDQKNDGVGANARTGKFVGGGAILGTIVGAIAGGGKGAAIGALAGSAAGASAQMATRGRTVYIPNETLLSFRLDRPLAVVAPDAGYDRDGHHYHR